MRTGLRVYVRCNSSQLRSWPPVYLRLTSHHNTSQHIQDNMQQAVTQSQALLLLTTDFALRFINKSREKSKCYEERERNKSCCWHLPPPSYYYYSSSSSRLSLRLPTCGFLSSSPFPPPPPESKAVQEKLAGSPCHTLHTHTARFVRRKNGNVAQRKKKKREERQLTPCTLFHDDESRENVQSADFLPIISPSLSLV